VQQLKDLSAATPSLDARVEPQRFPGDVGDRVGLVAAGDVGAQGVVLTLGESAAITRIDAEAHALIGALASESSELVALTLWLCAERMAGSTSEHATFLATLPVSGGCCGAQMVCLAT
jgi:histone-lysine N-methyltransferase SETD3